MLLINDWKKILRDVAFVTKLHKIDELNICPFITEPFSTDIREKTSILYNESLFDRMVKRHSDNGHKLFGRFHGEWIMKHAKNIPIDWRGLHLILPGTVVKDGRDHKGEGYNHRYFPHIVFCKDNAWHMNWRCIGLDRFDEKDYLLH